MVLNATWFTTRRVIVKPPGAGPGPFSGRAASPLETGSVCKAFAQWIVAQKRRFRPSSLYVVGVNGSVGQGKTVFSHAVVEQLNSLLFAQEGQAVTRSLDDYYLSHEKRYRPEFLSRGYNPEGIPNRGPAGTHDTLRLWKDIQALQKCHPDSILNLPIFDKQSDDRSPDSFRVQGRVGVFILEGWFVGARTDVDPMKAEPGLKRSVAEALKNYTPIFNRLDALWAFEPPPTIDHIVSQRLEQQDTLNRASGGTGMSPVQIRRFINYFYEDSWQKGLTSPTPRKESVNFWAIVDSKRRFDKINPGF